MRAAIRHRTNDVTAALESSSLTPLLKRLYANRGIRTPDELNLALNGLIPPVKLKGAREAATAGFLTFLDVS